MTADNRSTHTDALATLGTIIDDSAARDAIHLAVEPVICGDMRLNPGEHVFLRDGKAYGNTGATGQNLLGIVDPFLAEPVKQGQRFWLVVYPRQITSLRHVWTHPAFAPAEIKEPSPDKAVSEAWLRNFISGADCPDYDTVIAAAQGLFENDEDEPYYSGGGYLNADHLHFNGRDAHGEIPPDFWTHIAIVTGKQPKHCPAWFSCSC